ncbi:tRNA (N6-isopentenyl adenosine(37)-C2)-methylthiotransferase MiaB [Polymorphobacter fuscus]|uniref:tRNA-2-methylthio-N(6)-dimethylallyladenosine synthase n=1 Tax=Sandarakinorhabdus fusca TaxID=1439888 RepID=A0A7C9KJJ5_9SPHN|nr:tRNA (N6-isopentenyl adenosine(37)-C2)-methylthiotransferase MiaB [Polymorphobacter fuscus]KAB7645611.1 tRNA (N6-isopentenyl adenosine(37)-C2)-methylthiotransferase MiaB [Polymorphobacter fuscus]MQT18061.1 tRNA (N6-isopentenyl adenosine(37)-C2)-methylthiotransferase MiaB [Polymorphobacter fuscus]
MVGRLSSESSQPVSRYHVKSFGCQMNVYDSERMGDLLAADGHVAVDSADAADIVVLNTCHIREKAAEKLYSDIGRLKKPRADGSRPVIVAAGCVAQAEGAEIGRRAPAVDVIVGPLAYHNLPALLREAAAIPADARGARWGRAIDTDMPASPKFDHLPARRHQGASAFLTVQEGCDKFCTFCVVPYTRGGEVSRPFADLVREAETLVAAGAVEITLIGQNVNAYGLELGGGATLPALIAELAQLEGLKRIRYTTSHPRDMTRALIDAHAEIPKLMPYLHLPVQSGSSRILKAMNRAHTRESYLATLAELRAARPDIALSGDFIVGFPGETEADFADTLRIVSEVGYAQAYSFKYSQRPGTPAATMADQVPEAVKEERLARLQAAITAGAHAFNLASVGRHTEILLERPGRKPGQLIGKTPWLQSAVVSVTGAKIGDLIAVEITEGQPNSVEARPVDRAPSLPAERAAA